MLGIDIAHSVAHSLPPARWQQCHSFMHCTMDTLVSWGLSAVPKKCRRQSRGRYCDFCYNLTTSIIGALQLVDAIPRWNSVENWVSLSIHCNMLSILACMLRWQNAQHRKTERQDQWVKTVGLHQSSGLHKTAINVMVEPTQEGALESLQDSWGCNRCHEHTR